MTKFAPVAPIHVYEELAQKSPEAFGDYFLLLAHDVLAHPKRYEKVFKNKGYTIILDNSVVELGEACTAENLYEACDVVNPNCVAIPDVLEDGEATVKAVGKFFRDWDELYTVRKRNYHKMFIPQGKDLQDFFSCVEKAEKLYRDEIEWIGIPRNTTRRITPSRKILVAYAHAVFSTDTWNPKIHLLGFSADIQDDINTSKEFSHLLKGIDSAVPLRITQNISSFNIVDPGPRGNWWETARVTTVMVENLLDTRARIEKK